ncbi:MAG: copper homeostasis protein CutC [Bacteroidota bacterium]
MPGPSFELACFDQESVRLGCRLGVERLELCSQRSQEGLTPDESTVEAALQNRTKEQTRILVMLRPDADDGDGSDSKVRQIADTIHCWKNEGVDGFVVGFGVHHPQEDTWNLNKPLLKQIIAMAPGKEWVFHRLVDRLHEPHQALGDLQAMGFRRVLSSGGSATAYEGWDRLMAWQKAYPQLELLAGGGLRYSTVRALHSRFPREANWPLGGLHSSCILPGSDTASEVELSQILDLIRS